MPKFNIRITETRQRMVAIDADSATEALALADKKYFAAGYVLYAENIVDVSFACISEGEPPGWKH